MNLPPFPDLSDTILRAILRRHDLQGQPTRRLPATGIFNAIFLIGDDLILRVPREHSAFVGAARKEADAVPAVRTAGVRTPALVAFDDTLALLPVPYGLYERVRGTTIEQRGLEPDATVDAYRDLGRDLARLHAGVARAGPVADLAVEALPSPDPWPDELAAQGYLGRGEARWLTAWLRHLRAKAGTDAGPEVLRHGDVQASNVMVDQDGSYLALLDWGGCGWGDAAHDFAGVPMRAVPFMLDGYRTVRPVPDDGSFEARIVLRQLHLALFLVRRPPQPDKSWAERPLAMLTEMLRFLGVNRDETWRALLI